jgi:hypothetical protein
MPYRGNRTTIHVTILSTLAFAFVVCGIVLKLDNLLRGSLTLATLAVVEVLRLLWLESRTVTAQPNVDGARRAQRTPSTKGWPWAPQQPTAPDAD